jgi:hypothetical protein
LGKSYPNEILETFLKGGSIGKIAFEKIEILKQKKPKEF